MTDDTLYKLDETEHDKGEKVKFDLSTWTTLFGRVSTSMSLDRAYVSGFSQDPA